jgi:hypothetical protein
MLQQTAQGFGALALSALWAQSGHAAEASPGLHCPARAKHVIFLYMDGGPSQVDTFDYKPRLEKHHGEDPRKAIGRLEQTQFDNVGKVFKSPWKFKQHGESGLWVSELFPHVAEVVDELCVLRSMTSKFPEHTSANYFLHSGTGLQGRPSMGAWATYGLGSENEDLPGFIVLNGGLIPSGGLDCFGSGFLPAKFQGSIFQSQDPPVANIQPNEPDLALQREKLSLVHDLDRLSLESFGAHDAIESAIANHELAARMQLAVPRLMNLDGESNAVKRMYGLESAYEHTRTFAYQCLLARRMVAEGVRFVELTCPRIHGNDRWDAHSNLSKNHADNARATDQPIAALLQDLKTLGLLDETLVVWGGEFGRTPFAQGSNGRDHNQFGFTMWMAGAGIRTGITYGATDEWGYHAVEYPLEIHDLHATVLHLMGIDHTKLTFRFSGRDIRLTDVSGIVVDHIL